MKLAKLTAAAALAFASTAALANPQVVTGATVTGPEGNTVGTIEQVANGQAVLNTGKHKVPLAVDMYGEGESGPTITVTKAQLDTMMDQQIAEANAKRDAALIAGAAVLSADGQPVGAVKSVEGDASVVETADGGAVALKREHFAVGQSGLMALFTVAQLEAAIAQAGEQAGEQAGG